MYLEFNLLVQPIATLSNKGLAFSTSGALAYSMGAMSGFFGLFLQTLEETEKSARCVSELNPRVEIPNGFPFYTLS